ncbi:hypothetical protein O1W68_20205 [Rhodococcus sp. H36-A4]|uniref:hypothetical protein n=1 Tax=Rhodococcus sp. H36-A4 TaxID=3004353 RepID=UPI0022AE6C82|nr:hypothetical protein [Rhodococcus sp. H36-A4]MCZ4080274.1 hypothetical protein [Rhodococcus sp. H36-A4]
MSARLRRVRVVSVVLLMMLAAITACDSAVEDGFAPGTTSTSRWPAINVYEVPDRVRDATMVWSAEPGIDLFSAEGTVIRAAGESLVIGLMVGLDYTYVGFAASSNSVAGGPMYSLFQADTGQGPFVGTVHSLIQQVVPTDAGFDVLSCALSVGLDVLVDGKYSPSRLTDGDGQELRSRFIRTGNPLTSPAAPQPTSSPVGDALHWQAPAGNQFGGWEVDGFIDIDPVTSGKGRCAPWAQSLYPDAPRIITRDAYARDTPPPVQPAYPGWPNGSN